MLLVAWDQPNKQLERILLEPHSRSCRLCSLLNPLDRHIYLRQQSGSYYQIAVRGSTLSIFSSLLKKARVSWPREDTRSRYLPVCLSATMSSTSASTDISSGVAKLSLETSSPKTAAKSKSKPKKQEVADSWEEEDVSSSGSDTETESGCQADSSEGHPQGTAAPPPTPISPIHSQSAEVPSVSSVQRPRPENAGPSSPSPRPEKTDAVARRMIAGALGLKVPKLTDEQKAYQKAIREKERKRRDEEKAEQKRKEEEAAKARAAIWDD